MSERVWRECLAAAGMALAISAAHATDATVAGQSSFLHPFHGSICYGSRGLPHFHAMNPLPIGVSFKQTRSATGGCVARHDILLAATADTR
jgi:hypothetical protein